MAAKGVYTVSREKSGWGLFKERGKEIKNYLKGKLITKGSTYQPPVQDYFETEKYYGPNYHARRKKRNKQSYQSRRFNSMRRRGKA